MSPHPTDPIGLGCGGAKDEKRLKVTDVKNQD